MVDGKRKLAVVKPTRTVVRRRIIKPRSRRRPVSDEFGLDPEFRARAMPLFRVLYEKYWRVDARGARHVPKSGPVILVSNHSGALPFDATMIACALEEARYPRPPRFLYDRFVENLPWIPSFYKKAGGVVASHENAARLLEKEELIGLFPEGVSGLSKLYSERYVLQPFSGGFIRLALRFGAPIVPVAVVGAEEIYPLVGRLKGLGKLMGAPYLPVTPFFPLLGPLGLIPLPTKWQIRFGKPIVLAPPAHLRLDGTAVRAMAEQVRRRVQTMIRALLLERESVF
ncbi:MAG: phospholipid/glycerol acyltransferase [Deltaproteobacteria bacterium]|nr:phospholipid/glycerol acyltransferase [Deltaproteobacteria bacterium]